MSYEPAQLARIDNREDKGGWSYGKTWCEWRTCDRARGGCGHSFLGDKTAFQCAPCAYGDHEGKP